MKSVHARNPSAASLLALAVALGAAPPAFAQAQPDPTDPLDAAGQAQRQDTGTAVAGEDEQEIVVTGFRSSINAAIEDKREASGVVDVIRAEDIADFPDNNLAESIQRVPGVAIARDGGEGRSISVRGLGPGFTRVRINGMESIATTGSSDAGGGVNRTRGFDFNVFASELFNSITVRKTASAEVEEGSLGATVDLQTARPFDYRDPLVIAGSAQVGYNDLSDKATPRLAGLISWQSPDEQFGVLVSAAYSERKVLEEGHSTVRWSPTGVNGGFNAASTLPGYTVAQINTAPLSNGSNWDSLIYHPRIPRYDTWQYDLRRLGVTGAAQWRPGDDTLLTVEALYSDSDTTRTENYIEAISFSRSGAAGKPQTIIRTGEVNEDNELVYGVFDDVDMRIESRLDELETEFQQYTGTLSHDFSDTVRLTAFGGWAKSAFDNPVQTTITLDRLNSDGFSWDYRDNDREPVFNWGFDVANPASWSMINGSSDIRIRPQTATNTYRTGKLLAEWDLSEDLTFKAGGEWRRFRYAGTEMRRLVAETQSPTLTPAQIADLTTVLGGLTGDPNYDGYLIPDYQAFVDTLGIYCNCVQTINGQSVDFRLGGIENTNARSSFVNVQETEKSGFLQADFKRAIGGMMLRGDIGIRYVDTNQVSSGYANVTRPSGPSIEFVEVERDYDHWLPSLNLALEITPELIARFGTAKVITRPGLGTLSPAGSLTAQASNRNYSTGNPFLDPTEATNFDLALEWYFDPGSLLAFSVFRKDISTLSGTNITTQVPYTELGLPPELLTGTGVGVNDIFNFTRTVNGAGGKLDGLEINYQHQLRFLPGFLSNLGVLANYTYVDAKLEYPGYGGVGPALEGPLLNLSKESANATLFYEDDVFSIRGSASYRSGYLTQFGGGAREQSTEEGVNSTLNFDASASFNVTENITLTAEAINLTNEAQDLYIDEDDQVVLYHRTGRQFWLGVRARF